MPPKRHSTSREALLAAVIMAAISLLFLRPSIRGFDGPSNYVFLVSLLKDGDLNFENEYHTLDARANNDFSFRELPRHPVTGLPINQYGVGAALFWSPFVIPTHLALKTLHPEAATGFSRPYEWAVGIGSAFWSGLGLWLLWRQLRQSFSGKISALTILALTFATALCFYQWAHTSMSHAVSFFCTVMVLLVFERCVAPDTEQSPSANGERRVSRFALPFALGVWAGLLIITRFQDAPWAIVGVGLLWFSPQKTAVFRAKLAAAFVLGFVLALLPQMAAWNTLYGSPFTGPQLYMNQGYSHFGLLPVHFFELLFSGHHGALTWHPVLMLGLIGVVLAWKRREEETFFPSAVWSIGLLGILGQIYLLSGFSVWWAGASFGNRYFISSYPWLGLGFAWLLARMDKKSPRSPELLVAGLIVWNAGLLIQYATQMISREHFVSWQTILDNQFRAVPRFVMDKLLHLKLK
jgi:hypothetical protein